MSIEIEIASGNVDKKGGTIRSGERAGQAWEIRTQEGYIYNGHAHPERIVVQLDPSNAGYAPGRYTIDPTCFYVGDFRSLQLAKTLLLVPVKGK